MENWSANDWKIYIIRRRYIYRNNPVNISCMNSNRCPFPLTVGGFWDAGRPGWVQGVPLLDPVPRGGAGTEAGTGWLRIMPSTPFTELALAHAQKRVLWTWRIEDWLNTHPPDLTGRITPPIIPAMRMPGKYTLPNVNVLYNGIVL